MRDTSNRARGRLLEREYADQVVRRAEHLPPEDRALLSAVYADGRSVKDLAAMLRCEPRKVRRRVRGLTRRILSDRYIFVVSHRDSWPALRRRLATACFLHGRSIKDAAAGSGTSFYNARKQLDAVHALLDAIVHARSRPTTESQRHRDNLGEESARSES